MDINKLNSSSNGDSWDDRVASSMPLLGGDDILVPTEFLDTCRRKTYYEPEKKLMLALLNDAIYCFQHYLGARKQTGKKLFVAADLWIMQSGGDWLYSFDSVCEHLGIDPNYLRSGLQRYKERRLGEAWNQVQPRLMAMGG